LSSLAKRLIWRINADSIKVRRKLPLTPFISSIKSIKSVLVTSSDELTVSGITAWLSNYGEIVYVQVIKPGMEIPDNLRVYSTKHSELGNRPVGVVEFETPEAAHRCCRELDSGSEGEARVCLLGTRIRSFARHRRKKDSPRFDNDLSNRKDSLNKERLSPSDSSTDSAISDGSSSQEGSLPREINSTHHWGKAVQVNGNRFNNLFSFSNNSVQRPATQKAIQATAAQRHARTWISAAAESSAPGSGSSLLNPRNHSVAHQSQVSNMEQLRKHQQQLIIQEKLLQAARMQYQNALYLAHHRHHHQQQQQQQQQQRFSQYNNFIQKSSYAAPPPGLEPESEVSEGISQSIHSWLDKLSMSD
jgi:hypothetical protein